MSDDFFNPDQYDTEQMSIPEGVIGIRPEQTYSAAPTPTTQVNVTEFGKDKILYVHNNKGFKGDTLQIGDILFAMPSNLPPPQAIQITDEIVNFKWQALRTQEPFKVASGLGSKRIGITLYFVGLEQINTGLIRLIATFDTVPFVYIENEFVRATVSPNSDENIAVSLISLSMRTEQGLTNVIAVDLELSVFNYYPYSPHFWFREKYDSIFQAPLNVRTSYEVGATKSVEGVFIPNEAQIEKQNPTLKREPGIAYSGLVLKPQDSEPLTKIISMNQGERVEVINNRIVFNYNIYRIITSSHQQTYIGGKENINLLRPISTPYLLANNPTCVLKLHPDAASALEAAVQEFCTLMQRAKRSFRFTSESCFRDRKAQQAEQEQNRNEAAKGYSWHETGLAIDINQSGFTRDQWIKFVQIMKDHGFENLGKKFGYTPYWPSNDQNALSVSAKFLPRDKKGNRLDHESWHWDYVKGQERVLQQYGSNPQTAIPTYVGTIFFTSGEPTASGIMVDENGEPITAEQVKEKELQARSALSKMIGQHLREGWLPAQGVTNSTRIVLYRPLQFVVDNRDPDIVPQGLVVSKHNLIAQIPIQGYNYATQQYMGRGDMDSVIVFLVRGSSKLGELQHMVEITQQNARIVRELRDASVVDVENCVFKLAGLDQVMFDGIEIQSVSGQPDLYSVTLRLTHAKRRDLRVNYLQQEHYVADSAWRVLAHAVYSKLFSVTGENLTKVRWTELAGNENIDFFGKDFATTEAPARFDWEEIPNRPRPYVGLMQRRRMLCTAELVRRDLQVHVYDPVDKKWSPTYAENYTDDYITKIRETLTAEVLYEYAEILASILNRPLSPASLFTLGMDSFTELLYTPGMIDWDADLKIWAPYTPDEEQRIIEKIRGRLGRLFNKVVSDGLYLATPWWEIYPDIAPILEQQLKGLPCYPDLQILPHPTTGQVIDSAPDFWFWNPALDGAGLVGDVQQSFIESTKGILAASYDSMKARLLPDEYNSQYVSPNKLPVNVATQGADSSPKARLASTPLLQESWPMAKQSVDYKVVQQLVREYQTGQNINNMLLPSASGQLSDKPLAFGRYAEGELVEEKAQRESQESITHGESPRLQDMFERSVVNMDFETTRLAKAFPTFKIYFLEEDELEQGRLRLRNFDDFYSYSAIKDIRYVDSHQMPASLCVISIININGELDALQFTAEDANSTTSMVEKFDPAKIDTKHENPFSRLILMEGSKIQLRLGYSNDPENLTTVFNGQVVEVGVSPLSQDIIQLVCQSYGVELVANPKTGGSFVDTQELLCSMICSPEVVHFGRWIPNATYDPAELRTSWQEDQRAGLLGSLSAWSAFKAAHLATHISQNKPQDDNIFAPNLSEKHGWDKESVLNMLKVVGVGQVLEGLDIIDDDHKYIPYQSTVWDIFKEMELRHPGFVAGVRPYGTRCTMFFGPPGHGYWSRPLTRFEMSGHSALQRLRESNDTINFAFERYGLEGFYNSLSNSLKSGRSPFGQTLTGNNLQTYQQLNKLLEWLLIGRADRYRSFRGFHLLSSQHNIIANNMYASAHGTFNAVDLLYAENPINPILKGIAPDRIGSISWNNPTLQEAIVKNGEHFTMKADDNIRDRFTRTMAATYTSCQGSYFARCYSVGLLMRSLRDVYKGEIAILGDPSIKPYDVCLAPWSEIYTPSGWKKIDTLDVGEIVYTHKGQERKIKQIMKRKPVEQLYTIKTCGAIDPIVATANHPFYVLPQETVKDPKRPWVKCEKEKLNPVFKAVNELKNGDYLLTPIPLFDENIPLPLCRLLGYYLAEGNIIYENRKTLNRGYKLNRKNQDQGRIYRVPVAVQWTLHEKETALADEIDKALTSLGLKKANRYHNVSRHSLTCIIYNRNLAEQMITMGGVGSHSKILAVKPSREGCLQLLGAYLNGDGSQLGQDSHQRGTIRAVTVSRDLVRSLFIALGSVGIAARLISRTQKSAFSVEKTQTIYELSINNKDAQIITPYTKWQSFPRLSKRDNTRSWVWKNYIVSPIKSIEVSPSIDEVFNIAVEEDESYVVDTIAVHNCFLYDSYRDIYGPIEVGQVTHILSQETGFITQIKPDLIVMHDTLATMSTMDAMWHVSNKLYNGLAEGLTGLIGGTVAGVADILLAGSITATTLIGGISLGLALTGGYKLMQYAQSRQPILYMPVVQGGKPLLAGLDGYKRDGILMNMRGRWERLKGEVAEGAKDIWERDPIWTTLQEIGVWIVE